MMNEVDWPGEIAVKADGEREGAVYAYTRSTIGTFLGTVARSAARLPLLVVPRRSFGDGEGVQRPSPFV